MDQDNTKKDHEHSSDTNSKKDEAGAKVMDKQDQDDQKKKEHNKEADKIGKF